jgi:hypothetical protein
MKRLRNALFLAVVIAGFVASREANARVQPDACWACTGIFGETCEPCQGGEDCGQRCWDQEVPGEDDCFLDGLVCERELAAS